MPTPGELLAGRYRIGGRLGSGGMATVHSARDERLERDVAIKILLPNHAGDPATASRFEREARSLAAASNPGVVAVYDVDSGDPTTGREPFFVMELCPGGSLADRLAGGRRLSPDDIVPVLVSIADGLADLHRRGVVHRDVKPQNILFAADRAKLADFGLAVADGEGLSQLTAPGTAVGTLAYLAPEILAGDRASAAADVYALGVVAFVALTAELPRPAGSMAELVTAAQVPARRPSAVAPELGPAFDGVIGAALAPKPADRPDALGLAAGLTTALGRWSRDGGAARRASAGVAGVIAASAANAAATSGPVTAPGPADAAADAPTATALPLGSTMLFPVGSIHEGPVAQSRGVARRRPAPMGWLLVGASLVVVLAAALLVLPRLGGLFVGSLAPSAGPSAAPSAPPSAPRSPSPSPSPSPSIAPTPTLAPPTADPAIAAIDAMDAAIADASGGHDGLKGKEARDLQSMANDVRQALMSGDRGQALDAARQLDRRVADLGDQVGEDQANRLSSASSNLLSALGG